MEASIKCCEWFPRMMNQFDWFSFLDDKGDKIYCMPCVKDLDDNRQLRVNYCPSCGKEVRGIELKQVNVINQI